MHLVGDIVPAPTIDELAQAIEKAQSVFWKMGLTGVHDFDQRDCFMALQTITCRWKVEIAHYEKYSG